MERRSNKEILQDACEIFPYWADIITEADREIESVLPGYIITQIKEKFGDLRYYIAPPEGYYDAPEQYGNRFKEALDIAHKAEFNAPNIFGYTYDDDED